MGRKYTNPHYKVQKHLGLNTKQKASGSEIKKSYYKLAREFHPDKNPSEDAKKKFQKIQKAYEILTNKTNKREKDQYNMKSVVKSTWKDFANHKLKTGRKKNIVVKNQGQARAIAAARVRSILKRRRVKDGWNAASDFFANR